MNKSETHLSPKPVRPDRCEDTHLEFLDDLRESGATNMWGGGSYVEREFGLSKKDAGAILLYWMATFSDRQQS